MIYLLKYGKCIIMKESASINIVSILLTIIVLLQNGIWLFWYTGAIFSFLFITILFLFFIYKQRFKVTYSKVGYIVLSFFVFIIIPFINGGSISGSSVLYLLLIILLYNSFEEEKTKVLDYLTNILSVIILISLPLWIIHTYVVPFPLYNQLDLSAFKGNDFTVMNNYIFFVTPEQGLSRYRFYSVFDEPGVLGTLSSFVLFGNRYNFRSKKNIIIFVGALMTFSFAFILLTLLGVFWQTRKSFSKILKYIVFLSLSALILFYFLKDEPSFQNSVISRVTNIFDPETFSRTESSFNKQYEAFVNSTSVIWGKGEYATKQIGGAASYKIFIFQYGFVGLFMILSIYWSLIKRHTFEALGCLLLFCASFYQRPLLFTAWQLILFACITSKILSKKC